uniref:PDZ domain-containing protein n=1 Tax=Heterorhabditis bacteriophora TaxID=37862 RepID=A0A1I7XS73_HETBA
MCFTTHVVFCDTVDAIYVVNITTNESNLSDNKGTMNDLTHLDNDSAIDNSSTLSGVQRGNEILNKLRKHKFSERDKIHEDDIICNCNGALCDVELVQILGKQYKVCFLVSCKGFVKQVN